MSAILYCLTFKSATDIINQINNLIGEENSMNGIEIVKVESGREYSFGKFLPNELQYMDRDYIFNYIPEELKGCAHIRTCGNDKLIPESEPCFTMKVEHDVDVYILYPDKQPVIPKWLESFERLRMNVTRVDSRSDNLKGYFTLFKKHFPAGLITLYGNSPLEMLAKDWYVTSGGINYCMYSVAVKEVDIG